MVYRQAQAKAQFGICFQCWQNQEPQPQNTCAMSLSSTVGQLWQLMTMTLTHFQIWQVHLLQKVLHELGGFLQGIFSWFFLQFNLEVNVNPLQVIKIRWSTAWHLWHRHVKSCVPPCMCTLSLPLSLPPCIKICAKCLWPYMWCARNSCPSCSPILEICILDSKWSTHKIVEQP